LGGRGLNLRIGGLASTAWWWDGGDSKLWCETLPQFFKWKLKTVTWGGGGVRPAGSLACDHPGSKGRARIGGGGVECLYWEIGLEL